MSKVPAWLTGRLVALALMTGAGAAGTYVATNTMVDEGLRDRYVQAVAADQSVSEAVKIAMVMGAYYESSGKHIGKPYVDKNGRGQPLTVCNGVTGPEVRADRYYTPADCYELERGRYIQAEREARALLPLWHTYTPLTKATFIDFAWKKGSGALASSTMRRLANAGDLAGACAQMPRWNKGTVNGVLKVLPGLQERGDANGELCVDDRNVA